MKKIIFVFFILITALTFGFEINVIPKPQKIEIKDFPQKNILEKINFKNDAKIIKDGYKIVKKNEMIDIFFSSESGRFYAEKTLEQLKKNNSILPNFIIEDFPRYHWRGFMVDEARHFFGKKKIKQLLDAMALHKMNRFHWHLTDVEGWRIEIKKYPKLSTVGGIGDRSNPQRIAQFYTQNDIKEIVKYAAERHIEIIPEIDMPGHADAMNRAYPEFSGGGNLRWPHFTLNLGKEETYCYLQEILQEIADIFPSKWINFGGDEVHFANQQWAKMPEIKNLMQREKLKNLIEVEQYFNRRMAKKIRKMGKVCMGWDEVVAAGLPSEGTLVTWWRHDKPEILRQALDKNFTVILSPRHPFYFDFVQEKNHQYGRIWDGFNDLQRVYNGVDLKKNGISEEQEKNILGIQGCLWTEVIGSHERFDFMIFPRLAALAENAWTNLQEQNYDSFLKRLPYFLKIYRDMGIKPYDVFMKSAEVEHNVKNIDKYIDNPE